MPLSKILAQELLQKRFEQAIDVSGAFNNCFFHSYAAHLLANDLPLPKDLFTFTSLLGANSHATQLQTLLPNQEALDLFTNYKALQDPNSQPLSPHFIVEKTIILGFLLREWFAFQLAKNITDNEEAMLTGENNVITLFTNYISFRAVMGKKELLTGSCLFESNEEFLEYCVTRPTTNLSTDENRFASYFAAAHGNDKKAITDYWLAEGYIKYCLYIAKPQVKLAPTDITPMLKILNQSVTIFNNDGSTMVDLAGDPTKPTMQVKLVSQAGHYHLLKTPATNDILEEYKRSHAQYLRDREAVLATIDDDKLATANNKPSLLVGAICPSDHVPWVPFESLLHNIKTMQKFIIANTKTTEQLEFSRQLYLLACKRTELFIRHEDMAYKAARKLHAGLTAAGNAYFKDQTETNYNTFKTACNTLLEAARPELESHRGCKQLLGNIALAVVGVGLLYLVAIGFNKAITGKFLFFSTDSAEKINAIKNSIQLSKPICI